MQQLFSLKGVYLLLGNFGCLNDKDQILLNIVGNVIKLFSWHVICGVLALP